MANQFDLSAMVREPAKIAAVPIGDIPTLLTQLSTIQTAMAARLLVEQDEPPESDVMLTVEEAAERLGSPWIGSIDERQRCRLWCA